LAPISPSGRTWAVSPRASIPTADPTA
jgi:hypothetical protein